MSEVALVMPGSAVQFEIKLPGVDRLAPQAAIVLRVMRGALVIAEVDSINGLGRIVIHGESGTKGTYWYSFTDLNGQGRSYHVTTLMVGYQPIITSSFFV